MLGYLEIGRENSAILPATTISIDMTEAKMGLATKNLLSI